MRRRYVVTVIAFALAASALAPGLTTGAEPGRIRAFLGDREIPARESGRHHCHDFEFPVIRCYRSGRALDRAVATSGRRTAADGLSVTATNYVRVFEHQTYAGASAYLAYTYSDLRTIGWNDKITSYIVVNGGSGAFYEHIDHAGLTDSFCCGEWVSNVGSTFNDKFSSVEGSA